MVTAIGEVLARADINALPFPGNTARDDLTAVELAAARRLLSAVAAYVDSELNQPAGLIGQAAELVTNGVLQAIFPAAVAYRHGDAERARQLVTHAWAVCAAVFCGLENSVNAPLLAGARIEPTAEDMEYLSLLNVALAQRLRTSSATAEGRRSLRRLLTALDISMDEAGRMLGVNGESVRRWERGLVQMPVEKLAMLTAGEAALDRLLELFRPERLPVVVRRPAELFDGEPALAWILRGRIADVADRYERALAYQA